MTTFTDTLLIERLLSAQRRQLGDVQLTRTECYALLAMPTIVPDAHAALATCKSWPFHVYAGVSPAVLGQVYRWLAENADGVSNLERRYSWCAQWHSQWLDLAGGNAPSVEIVASFHQKRPLTPETRSLYRKLQQRDKSTAISLFWLRHLSTSAQWDEVIETGSQLLRKTFGASERSSIYFMVTTALLHRRKLSADEHDGERALHLMLVVQREGLWSAEFDPLLVQCTEAALPAALAEGRGESTNILADAYRGLGRLGSWLGGQFGGRDAKVPYSEAVVKSAPSLVSPRVVSDYLDSSARYNAELARAFPLNDPNAEAAIGAGSVTAGMLWTYVQIDTRVLDAISFATKGAPKAFSAMQTVADGLFGNDGGVARMRGYVAEQQVILDLTSSGHVVELPSGPSQPGWDLRVDGHEVQVKCSLDADYVLEHFDKYPDIPVIVNAELAQELGGHPLVWVDEGLSYSAVQSMTEDSLDALREFGDMDDLVPLPVVGVVFAVMRNFSEVGNNTLNAEAFAQRVGIDVATKVAAGGVGTIVGGAVGSLLGPIGTMIGAGVGGFIGNVAGRTGGDALNRDDACNKRDNVVDLLSDYQRWFRRELLAPRLEVFRERHRSVAATAQKASGQSRMQHTAAVFYAISAEFLARATALNSWLAERESGDDFARTHAGWVALRESATFFHPELKPRLEAIRTALADYRQTPGAAG